MLAATDGVFQSQYDYENHTDIETSSSKAKLNALCIETFDYNPP